MKIQIQNLKPNPYRDIENYPINQEKIQSLKDSINQTGFWDNILARKVNGNIQIAYGHHRLEALKQILKPTDEVDIPVKKLSDALMIKIMANENMDEWKTSPKIIDETVRITKQFLEEHPDEIKKIWKSGNPVGVSVGFVIISRFLGWEEKRVSYSLERLNLIDKGELDKEAVHDLPTDRAARDFVKAVKDYELPIEKQKAAVEKIKETSRGEKAVRDAVIEHKWEKPEKKIEFKSEQVKSFENFIGELRNDADDLYEKLRKFVRLENEIGEYDKTVHRKLLNLSLNTLAKQINLIINTKDNEKTEFTDSDSSSIAGQLES